MVVALTSADVRIATNVATSVVVPFTSLSFLNIGGATKPLLKIGVDLLRMRPCLPGIYHLLALRTASL
jgi:hypothetical protein